METRITKRKIQNDISAFIFTTPMIVGLAIIGVLGVVGTIGLVSYLSKPDVTYNVSEGGLFNLAGMELGGLEIVAVIVAIIIVIALFLKSKK